MKAIKTTIAQSGVSLYVKAQIIGTIAGASTIILLMCLLSVMLMIAGTLPYDYLSWITLLLSSAGVFASGYVSSRIVKEKGMLNGVISALIIFVIVICSGLLMSYGVFTVLTALRLAVYLITGALSGILAVNKSEKIRIR